MAKAKLPRSGSHESVLRGHLLIEGVTEIMLLWGSQLDRFTQSECVRRLARAGVELERADDIHDLYRLAVDEADKLTAG